MSGGTQRAQLAGVATAIGSLPHTDAHDAAALVLRLLPELPAAPQLPRRTPAEGMLAQWLRALPELDVDDTGGFELAGASRRIDPDGPIAVELEPLAHGGLLAFIEAAANARPQPAQLKAQVTGPLTLGCALARRGIEVHTAFERATALASAWARRIEAHVRSILPDSGLVLFFDEPALVEWNDEPPIGHERASDLLSSAFAAVGCATGVHVCGGGDASVALAAGPDILGVEVSDRLVREAAGLARFLDGGGFVAWGAVPTHRPIGESGGALWRSLVEVWCDLSRRGCDGLRLRCQSIITPACGLAGHGPSQAERALMLTREIAARVFDQAAATKLIVGA
jgi:methionine synthase II (cobalamin-independent)